MEVAQQLLAVAGGRGRGGDGGGEVMDDALPIGEQRVVTPPVHEAARGGLLVGHPHRALEDRPALAVARVEGVVDLLHEVREAALVETLGVRLAEGGEPRVLSRRDVRVLRLRGGREVVRGLSAHLVKVHHHVRIPLQVDAHAPHRLRLGKGEPVAVHVEQVVVRAAAGPGLVALRGHRVGVGHGGAADVVLGEEPCAAVWVLERIDEDDGLAEDRVDRGIALGGEEMVGLGEGGVRRRDLVAVNGVDQPRHDGQIANETLRVSRPERTRIGQASQIRLDRVQPRDAFRRRDDHGVQRAAFPGTRVLEEARALGGGRGQRAQVGDDLVGARNLGPEVVAGHRLQRGDARVVARARGQIEWRRCDERRQENRRDHIRILF